MPNRREAKHSSMIGALLPSDRARWLGQERKLICRVCSARRGLNVARPQSTLPLAEPVIQSRQYDGHRLTNVIDAGPIIGAPFVTTARLNRSYDHG